MPIVILTSNPGARDAEKNSIGFGSLDQSDDAQDAAVKASCNQSLEIDLMQLCSLRNWIQTLMKSVTGCSCVNWKTC